MIWWGVVGRRWQVQFERRARGLTLAWLSAALIGFVAYAHGSYPLSNWLSFFLARAWAGALLFSIAAFAVGLRLVELLQARLGDLAERTVIAMAVGVLTFAVGIFVAGLFGLLGLPFFFAWPALLILVGARSLARYHKRVSRLWARFGSRVLVPQSLVQALSALLIAAGVSIIYLQIITPNNIGFDARWYHLAIAEGYASAGRIRSSPEGWYLGAYPHLASWLYTWAFLAPGSLKHHLCLAAHLEFVLFLATVGGVSVLGARLIDGTRLRLGGAALFLFPGIFISDSNLNLGAEHVLAFWAAPLGLVLLRYLAYPRARYAALLGTLAGAAGLTKYQAVYFMAPLCLVLAVDLVRRRQPRLPLIVVSAALIVSAPHWLKNWLAYGDPLYPNLYRWLPDHPLFQGAVGRFAQGYWFSGEKAPTSATHKLVDAARTLFEFSFFPHGHARGRDESMVVGSLFTLLLPLTLLVRPRWRVSTIAGSVYLALSVWALTYPYDRYLQALVPWMAACSAATLSATWRLGNTALRAALASLVGFQILWGGDIYLLHAQAMLGDLPLRALNVATRDKKYSRNPYPGEELSAIGGQLSKGSRLVAHDFYQTVGVGVELIRDNPDWQGGIDYLQLDAPEQVLVAWQRADATHVLWPVKKEPRQPEDLARDAVFGRASLAFTDSWITVAGYRVARLIQGVPAPVLRGPTRIAWLGCGAVRGLGIYTPVGLASGALESALSQSEVARDPAFALAKVNAVWLDPACAEAKSAAKLVADQFIEVSRSGTLVLWIRQRVAAPSD